MTGSRALWTIGYEDVNQAAVLHALETAGCDLLVDVRAIAASRRAGFAKSHLLAGTAAVGIEYLHLRGLGTPAEGRLAARTGRYDDLRRIFGAHLETTEAQAELAELASLIEGGRRVCLLCLERHPDHCHRSLIALELSRRLPVAVTHLMP